MPVCKESRILDLVFSLCFSVNSAKIVNFEGFIEEDGPVFSGIGNKCNARGGAISAFPFNGSATIDHGPRIEPSGKRHYEP